MQRRPRREHPKHLKWIRERPCVICGGSPCDACHIKFADGSVLKPQASNISMKADDIFTTPLCRTHHQESHSMPERSFWQKYHIDPILLSLRLWSVTGDDEMGDALVKNAMLVSWSLNA
jgi:hypothetical protein